MINTPREAAMTTVERAEQLITDCELGPGCQICKTLRALLQRLDKQAAELEKVKTPTCEHCGKPLTPMCADSVREEAEGYDSMLNQQMDRAEAAEAKVKQLEQQLAERERKAFDAGWHKRASGEWGYTLAEAFEAFQREQQERPRVITHKALAGHGRRAGGTQE